MSRANCFGKESPDSRHGGAPSVKVTHCLPLSGFASTSPANALSRLSRATPAFGVEKRGSALNFPRDVGRLLIASLKEL
jgi:hypothetical protein